MGRGFHRLIGMSLMMLPSQLVTLGHTPFYKPIGPVPTNREVHTHMHICKGTCMHMFVRITYVQTSAKYSEIFC